jgi:hypothetical protein
MFRLILDLSIKFFQSHIGPSTTRVPSNTIQSVPSFQFHIGPITILDDARELAAYLNFQSRLGPITIGSGRSQHTDWLAFNPA